MQTCAKPEVITTTAAIAAPTAAIEAIASSCSILPSRTLFVRVSVLQYGSMTPIASERQRCGRTIFTLA
jgi:hypothetical protein